MGSAVDVAAKVAPGFARSYAGQCVAFLDCYRRVGFDVDYFMAQRRGAQYSRHLFRSGDGHERQPVVFAESEVVVAYSVEVDGRLEAYDKGVVVDFHRFDVIAELNFFDKVAGGPLFGRYDAVYSESFENRLVELVDGAGVDMFDAEAFQKCHGPHAGSEILSDGNYDNVDILKRQHLERGGVGAVDNIGCRYAVFYRFHYRFAIVGADDFVAHFREVEGEV